MIEYGDKFSTAPNKYNVHVKYHKYKQNLQVF